MSRGEWVIWWHSSVGPCAEFFDEPSSALGFLVGWCRGGGMVAEGSEPREVQVGWK